MCECVYVSVSVRGCVCVRECEMQVCSVFMSHADCALNESNSSLLERESKSEREEEKEREREKEKFKDGERKR